MKKNDSSSCEIKSAIDSIQVISAHARNQTGKNLIEFSSRSIRAIQKLSELERSNVIENLELKASSLEAVSPPIPFPKSEPFDKTFLTEFAKRKQLRIPEDFYAVFRAGDMLEMYCIESHRLPWC